MGIDPSGNFTLVEMAVVIGIIAILAGLTAGIMAIDNHSRPYVKKPEKADLVLIAEDSGGGAMGNLQKAFSSYKDKYKFKNYSNPMGELYDGLNDSKHPLYKYRNGGDMLIILAHGFHGQVSLSGSLFLNRRASKKHILYMNNYDSLNKGKHEMLIDSFFSKWKEIYFASCLVAGGKGWKDTQVFSNMTGAKIHASQVETGASSSELYLRRRASFVVYNPNDTNGPYISRFSHDYKKK